MNTGRTIYFLPRYIGALKYYEKLFPDLIRRGFTPVFLLFDDKGMIEYCKSRACDYDDRFIEMGIHIPFYTPLVRERATAAGVAIGVWLAFVVLYDMGLLGLLVADQGRTISASALNVLLLANPTDVYRMLNLAGTTSVSAFAGMAALGNAVAVAPAVLVAALFIWMLLPLALAAHAFSRREL